MQIIIKDDYRQMSLAAATLVADAIRATPQMTLCLPTGNTPKGMYAELVRMHREEQLDFSELIIFNLDEYLGLPPGHAQSFATYLREYFLKQVNVDPANVHPPDERYEEFISRAGGIDLLISGIGTNGHIAFNEPGSPLDSRTRVVDLSESTLHGMRERFTPEELPHRAITMGLTTILETDQILLLASGAGKAEILAKALKGPVDLDVPASVLQKHLRVTLIADRDAGELSGVAIDS